MGGVVGLTYYTPYFYAHKRQQFHTLTTDKLIKNTENINKNKKNNRCRLNIVKKISESKRRKGKC